MRPAARFRAAAAAIALSSAFATAGCRDNGGRLFEIEGKLFVFNYREARVTYLVKLNPLAPVPDGTVAVAAFQDPAGGPALVVEQRIWPKLGKVTIESPPVTCVAEGRPYEVSIAIRDTGGAILQTIETAMISTVDQSVMPDVPLVVGPGYTPNPAAAGHPGGKLPWVRRDCPAF